MIFSEWNSRHISALETLTEIETVISNQIEEAARCK